MKPQDITLHHSVLKVVDTDLIKSINEEMINLSSKLEAAIQQGVSAHTKQIDYLCARISLLNSILMQIHEWRQDYNSHETVETPTP